MNPKRKSRAVKKHSIALIASDAAWMTRAARANDRSVAKLFHRIVDLWKRGEPVLLSVEGSGEVPLSFEITKAKAVEASRRFDAAQLAAERSKQSPPNLARKPLRRFI
jgi:hypothetical protein